MNNYTFLHQSAWEHTKALAKGEYSAKELALACLEQAEKQEALGAFLRLDSEMILKQAQASDERRVQKNSLGPLDGIPISIKDNICQQGSLVSCASRILENFISPYDATVIKKLRSAGAVLFGQTNMDEFAMGSSTENSAFQKTRNPWHKDRVPGGSSGGAAVSVAACITPLALGSDTGGSVRQPAAFCGVFGLRPTYGRVSRYGLVAFASSLDQIGPLSRDAKDCATLLATINGRDPLDATSSLQANLNNISDNPSKLSQTELKQLKLGVILPQNQSIQTEIAEHLQQTVDWFVAQGASITNLKPQLEEMIVAVYYILATAEASSNLSRFDGIRYGKRAQGSHNLKELYIRSRSEGFGAEVRRRILLGTFVLSSGYYDAYYKEAQLAQKMLQDEYEEFFQKVDMILTPTSLITAFPFGDRKDPLSMYKTDICTIPPALAGLPCLNVPVGLDKENMPIGLQFIAPTFADELLLKTAMAYQADKKQMLWEET